MDGKYAPLRKTYEVQKDGVGGVDGLDSAISVTVSPDGANVYAAGLFDNAAAVFSRAADADNDGVADNADNCPLIANADQTNTDGDAQGDACDSDDDNDGATDTEDDFPLDPAASVGTDGDGRPDEFNAGATPGQIAASPLVVDLDDDNDGVSDIDELAPGTRLIDWFLLTTLPITSHEQAEQIQSLLIDNTPRTIRG